MADMADKRIVYQLPGMDRIVARKDIPYKGGDGSTLGFDIYTPGGSAATVRPAVVFISGYPDPGFERMVGRRFKELGAYVSWAQLLASMGFVAITYQNVQPDEDAADIVRFLIDNAADYGIDPTQLAIWSCSGNVPCALNLLCSMPDLLKCAVFCYGFLLDLDGHSDVADACAQYRFVNASTGRTVEDIGDVPFLFVRAGKDQTPGLNQTADRFVSHALAANLPLTLLNHAQGVHAFDIEDDSERSRLVIQQILSYLRINLTETPD